MRSCPDCEAKDRRIRELADLLYHKTRECDSMIRRALGAEQRISVYERKYGRGADV